MIKIEFPANRPDIALAMSVALQQIATGTASAHVDLAARLQSHEGYVEDATNTKAIEAAAHQHVGAASSGTTTAAPHDADAELSHTAADSLRRDMKGVAFDPAYCANAAEPFYGSGKEKGQWKTKRGVPAETYAAWYAAQLANTAPTAADEDSDPTPVVQTGAAFGATPVSNITAPTPRNAGEFMAWVAEKQTAGRLSQDVINNAYMALGIRVTDLFPPTPENIIANNIGALHRELSAVAGA